MGDEREFVKGNRQRTPPREPAVSLFCDGMDVERGKLLALGQNLHPVGFALRSISGKAKAGCSELGKRISGQAIDHCNFGCFSNSRWRGSEVPSRKFPYFPRNSRVVDIDVKPDQTATQ